MALAATDAIGVHNDVYLLGAMLYEILTGTAPHTGTSVGWCSPMLRQG